MKTVLITGFEPFDGMPISPALEAIRALSGSELMDGEAVFQKVCVPVARGKSIDKVVSATATYQPTLVLMLGLAPGRNGISPKRVAINRDDFRIPDNEGNQVVDQAVVEDGPAAYFSTLPVKSLVHEMHLAGIPASLSNSTGTFVCNHLFYGVMHHLRNSSTRAGFIHIPLLPEQAVKGDQPSMSLAHIVKAISVCAETALSVKKDMVISGREIS